MDVEVKKVKGCSATKVSYITHGCLTMDRLHLLPVPSFKSGFTTCALINVPAIEHVPLEDPSLGVHKITSRTNHPLVTPPSTTAHSLVDQETGANTLALSDSSTDPKQAWEALYPRGSINPSGKIPGGFGFYLAGPKDFADKLTIEGGATHVVLSYRMMLQHDWEWVKGGKLPGIFGGEGDTSYSCTGGQQQHRCQCFNIRPMWRANGQGELYTYLPLLDSNRDRLSAVPPYSKQNPDYGMSVGRGAFSFDAAVGNWISLAFRVKLNEIGQEDGQLELFVEGKSVIHAVGLVFRTSNTSRIKGAHFQTFFGGHTEDWASPKDQRAWFTDVTGAVVG
ncbi:Polysaccharide lyase family 14 protein [Mycena indigotica]|uniref:Polysaccharide lyase family 14 protein n=1 Tax=Mycena indigotica TaxID=2126181 RepID=A0A8H6SFN2_9AGAR|nr:Polysaccharide lyase family 14 protein [Mycena indigotica]KAF7298663.1 Polysaccharide lyase family 14 protein [Mycena indigotica]